MSIVGGTVCYPGPEHLRVYSYSRQYANLYNQISENRCRMNRSTFNGIEFQRALQFPSLIRLYIAALRE